MLINADFNQRAAVHANSMAWTPSPMKGVDRRMLDRVGAESGHATSIVRYAPNSSFSPHIHTGGEEFLVLDGVFQDEHGDFPTGTYVRNPPTSQHTPRSDKGCTIFVKLWQFDPADRTQIAVNTSKSQFATSQANAAIKLISLFHDTREDVRLEQWSHGKTIDLSAPRGTEILVLEGEFEEGGEVFRKNDWLRLPRRYETTALVGSAGARVWRKSGNLAQTPLQK